MSCYRFCVEPAYDDSVEVRSLKSMYNPLSEFGLALLWSTPFELWAYSDSGCYSGTSVYVSTLDRDPLKLLIQIRSSEPQSQRPSKAKRLAEDLHYVYQSEFLCSEIEP